MTQQQQIYYTLLTEVGAAEFTNAPVSGTMVNLSHLAIGDGGGAPIIPNEKMKALVNEVHRVPISTVIVDPDNPNWLVAEAVLPATVGGWTIRELGALGGGKLLSVGNFPPTYKPFLTEGAAKDLTIRMIMQVSNASVVNLLVDPSVTVVTQKTLATILAKYLTKTEADARYLQSVPLASTTVQGLVELATVTEARTGTDTSRAVTPAGLKAVASDHEAHADPHPQYLTELEGDGKYLVQASTTVRGIAELATVEETAAGTDATRAVTPFGLAAVLPSNTLTRHMLVTANQDVVIPEGCREVRVYVIGPGADGEKGGDGKKGSSTSDTSGGYGGAGGSGGGCAWADIPVTPGQIIPARFTANLTSFGEYLSATAGVSWDQPGDGVIGLGVKNPGTSKGGKGGPRTPGGLQPGGTAAASSSGSGGGSSGSPAGAVQGGQGSLVNPVATQNDGGGRGLGGSWPGTGNTRGIFKRFTDPLMAPCISATLSEDGASGGYGGRDGWFGGGGSGLFVYQPIDNFTYRLTAAKAGHGGGGGGGSGPGMKSGAATEPGNPGNKGGSGAIVIFY